jgi:putative PIN family toxin of toxin-antitoxin system
MTARSPALAVLDTNVLLDFWVFNDARATPLRAVVESGSVRTLRSGPLVDELSDVLSRPVFGLTNERRCTILRLWDRIATPVEQVFPSPLACTDPSDQKFLDLAHTARADWLVTKDKALLKLARRARRDALTILTPAAACLALAEPPE